MRRWNRGLVVVLGIILFCSASYGTGFQIYCNYVCMDFDGDMLVRPAREKQLICAHIGEQITEEASCVDIGASKGTIGSDDILAFDNAQEKGLCNPEINESFMNSVGGASPSIHMSSGGPGSGGPLLIAGMKTINGTFSTENQLYIFNTQKSYVGSAYTPVTSRSNHRLTCDPAGRVYQVNYEHGLIRLNDGLGVVTPGGVAVASDPRYSGAALVFLGLQEEDGVYGGQPLRDAVVTDEYVYVSPVVVRPTADPTSYYLAAAKLQLHPGQTPCYSVVQLYDKAPALGDTRDPKRTGLLEIEVDTNGTVYTTNSNMENDSNFLWAYPVGGSPVEVALDTYSGVQGGIPSPTAMFASKKFNILYLASAINNPDANSVTIYGLSTENLSFTLARSITINGMGHVEGITEDPATGTLWVAGFRMQNIPANNDPNAPTFCTPCLAEISPTSNDSVTATVLTGSDIGVPYSIAWLPANLISSTPPDQTTLWRCARNTLRFYFDGDITVPTAGQILIQEMLPNGEYGPDLSSNFSFTVENDITGKPRVLRIREVTTCMPNKKWYAFRNTGGWKGVSTFIRQFAMQRADTNNDGIVNSVDIQLNLAACITINCADSDRRDYNGDGIILQTYDYALASGNNPSAAIPKPSGH